MNSTHRLAAIFISLLFSLPSQAARQFDIEILVFSRSGGENGSNEIWPGDPGTLDWDSSTRLQNSQILARAGWKLGAEKHALKRSAGKLDSLIHLAWRQTVVNRKNARAVYLSSNTNIAPGTPLAEGLVTVSVNRYLHVDLDLLLRGKSRGAESLPGQFRNFRFTAHRRMRSRELHYIDHPKMGVLIEITPVGG